MRLGLIKLTLIASFQCFSIAKAFVVLSALRTARLHCSQLYNSVVDPEKKHLSPEYLAALDQAKKELACSIPDSDRSSLSSMLPVLEHVIEEYLSACQAGFTDGNSDACKPLDSVSRILTGIGYGIKFGVDPTKFSFDVLHRALRGDPMKEDGNTIDFYQFGNDMFRPCMNLRQTRILGNDNIRQAIRQIQAGENVVLFANHQSEADPQVVSICLEQIGLEKEAADMVYVAGHKVTTDPLAIPFSMGRNLICVHSKKHIDSDPFQKKTKQKQNLLAMSSLLSLFKEGGCFLWIAPSGGRDRRITETGEVPVAPFDYKTIDMFRLMAAKSGMKTHFYTLAIVSYDLLPPPDFAEAGVGERRNVRYVPVGVNMGKELEGQLDLESRQTFSNNAMNQCTIDYQKLLKAMCND